MKILLEKNKFVKALTIGASFAGKNKLVPALANVKMKIKETSLSIVSSDGQNFISRKMMDGVSADGEMSFCIDPWPVLNYVKALPGDEIELHVDGDKADICHANGSFVVTVDSGANFPSRSSESGSMDVSMSSQTLCRWIAKSKDFVGKDTLRPVMNGIYLYKRGEEIGCCATDGNRLYNDHFVSEAGDDFGFILDASCFKAISDSLAGSGDITVSIGKSTVMFKSADTSLMCALLEGRYPNFKSVIGDGKGAVDVFVDRKSFSNALARCSMGAEATTPVVTLEFSADGKMSLASSDQMMGKGVTEYVNVDTQGDMRISFNLATLRLIVNEMESDEVCMSFTAPTKPCFLSNWSVKDNQLYLLMPMTI